MGAFLEKRIPRIPFGNFEGGHYQDSVTWGSFLYKSGRLFPGKKEL